MSNATEVFHQLDGQLQRREGAAYPLSQSLELQLRLAGQVEHLMTEAQQCIDLPDYLCGSFVFSDRPQPHSSTGTVLFVEQPGGEKVALKLLTKLDDANHFQPHHDPTYAFDTPAVRVMTALGETLMGKAANKNVPFPMYFGIGGVTGIDEHSVQVMPFSVEEVLAGKMEPVVVMRAMRTTLADVLMDTREAENQDRPTPYTKAQLREWSEQVLHKVMSSSVPLSADIAADIGSPKEIENLLVGKTIGWLASRSLDADVIRHPLLVSAVSRAQHTQEMFRTFFALPETQAHLAARAVPLLHSDAQPLGKMAHTFGPGDTKFGNVMIWNNANGQEAIGMFDPQWLVLNPGVIGNAQHEFAPWPFADLMQIVAYSAAQPAAYGFPELQQVFYDGLRQYYGKEHWTPWHELYLRVLTSYKLLVDVAFAIDPYAEKVSAGQDISRALAWILEKHPKMAVEATHRALKVYADQK